MEGRKELVAAALVGLLLTSGCIGFLTGSESLQFEASAVQVTNSAQQDAGYQEHRRESITETREFQAAGQTREVEVTNRIAEYSKSVSLPVFGDQEVARFSVLATPQVNVLGETFNPVGDMNNTQLALLLQEKYQGISNVRAESERSVTVAGSDTTVSKFRADAVMDTGQTTEVFLHVTKVSDGDDYLVAIAVYPTQLDGEQAKVDTMLRGIEHESDGG